MTPIDPDATVGMDITSELTEKLWRTMNDHYGTKVVPKARSPLMKACGLGLGVIGIMERDTFMQRYTTVVGRRIYPWFVIGEGSDQDLWYQMVVCVHEHQHVVQAKRDGLTGFSVPYLLSSRRRALIEAEAYRCNLEMNWWRSGEIGEPARHAAKLSQYGCDQDDVAAARQYLEEAVVDLQHGVVLNEASRFAIEYLERHR